MMGLSIAAWEGDHSLDVRTKQDKAYAKELVFETMKDEGLQKGSPKLGAYSPAFQKEYLEWLAKS